MTNTIHRIVGQYLFIDKNFGKQRWSYQSRLSRSLMVKFFLKLNTHFPIAQRRETAMMEVREFPDPQFSLNS